MMNENDDEVPHKELLSVILNDEALLDISLEGTDGVQVPANRTILGAKSRVFRQMLYGEYREASSPTIKLGFEGAVLKAIVEYIHTDSAPVLVEKEEDSKKVEGEASRVQTLVKLCGAAAYFNLPGLCKKIKECLTVLIDARPSLSLDLLEAGKQEGPSTPQQIINLALVKIRSITSGIMDNLDALAKLSPSALEEILKDEKLQVMELGLFKCLQVWAENDDTEGDRRSIAKELSIHIRLELINPVQLQKVVSPSGLFSEKQLSDAYMTHALAGFEASGNQLKKSRRALPAPIWKHSKSDVLVAPEVHAGDYEVYLLEYPGMNSGIHMWTLEIEELCTPDYTWVGMAKTGFIYDKSLLLGRQQGGWVYGNIGVAWGNESLVGPGLSTYEAGSKVTLTLNLLPDAENGGTLCASVDGGAPFTLFSNLRSELGNGGFIPAASLRSPGRVRILDVPQRTQNQSGGEELADSSIGDGNLKMYGMIRNET